MEDVDLTPSGDASVQLNRFLDQIPQALSRLSVDLSVKWQSRTARDEFGEGQGSPCYRAHFGRDEPEFTWEKTNKADEIRALAGL